MKQQFITSQSIYFIYIFKFWFISLHLLSSMPKFAFSANIILLSRFVAYDDLRIYEINIHLRYAISFSFYCSYHVFYTELIGINMHAYRGIVSITFVKYCNIRIYLMRISLSLVSLLFHTMKIFSWSILVELCHLII